MQIKKAQFFHAFVKVSQKLRVYTDKRIPCNGVHYIFLITRIKKQVDIPLENNKKKRPISFKMDPYRLFPGLSPGNQVGFYSSTTSKFTVECTCAWKLIVAVYDPNTFTSSGNSIFLRITSMPI